MLRDEGEAYAAALERARRAGDARPRSRAPIHGFWRWQTERRSRAAAAAATAGAAVRCRDQVDRADRAFWHPSRTWARSRATSSSSSAARARGSSTTTARRYLDGTASLWYANLGHGRTEIADAVAAQMRKLEAYHTFGDVSNRPADEICEALAARAPMAERQGLPDQRRR